AGGPRHQSLDTAITQTIDVSTGPTATLIAGGTARFRLSAYFDSYTTQKDHGIVQADFLDAASAVLGSATVTPGPQVLADWTQFLAGGAIPTATKSVKISSWGTVDQPGTSDGYTDNVDFQVTTGLPALLLTVNRGTGAMTLSNQTGAAVNISSYA